MTSISTTTPTLKPGPKLQLAILAGLALLMFVTRFNLASRFQHSVDVPDASWAVFFIAGFYLDKGMVRWAFPLLMLEAALIDWAAVTLAGVSAFCIAPVSYAFLIPAHAAMWFGGDWLRRNAQIDVRGLGVLAVGAVLSTVLAYAISNMSFYWLGGRVADLSFAGSLDSFAAYFWYFVPIPCAYILAAAIAHAGVARAVGVQTGERRSGR